MCRILIVDDEKSYCSLLERALRIDGLEVVATHDSHQAVDLLKMFPPFDMLVTDIDMPGLDGHDLVRLAEELPQPPKILLITAQKHLLQPGHCHFQGRHCLLKPFHLSDLRSKVALLTDCWHLISKPETACRNVSIWPDQISTPAEARRVFFAAR